MHFNIFSLLLFLFIFSSYLISVKSFRCDKGVQGVCASSNEYFEDSPLISRDIEGLSSFANMGGKAESYTEWNCLSINFIPPSPWPVCCLTVSVSEFSGCTPPY
ncbi:hypothetical protein DFH28DRAFT_981194 [Melampsora americana]|nr:hypothetical protein DFH28DRAFT_981194 [Melampsora americana]